MMLYSSSELGHLNIRNKRFSASRTIGLRVSKLAMSYCVNTRWLYCKKYDLSAHCKCV